MIICPIKGGHANQILLFSAAYALSKELNKELVLDITLAGVQSNGYGLDWFAIPEYKKLTCSMVETNDMGSVTWLDRVPEKEKYFEIYDSENQEGNKVYTNLDMAPLMGENNNIYLKGIFFDRDRYFLKYWEELRHLFVPKEEQREIEHFRNIITGKISVGIHIRRGDMLNVSWALDIEDEYYQAVITYCRKKFGKCLFMIFSDDIEYVKETFGIDEDYYYVNFLGYDNAALKEMQCLSLCTHRIMNSNSTFSLVADALNWEESRKTFWRVNNQLDHLETTIDYSKRNIYFNSNDIKKYSKNYQINGKYNIENYIEKQEKVLNASITKENSKEIIDILTELSMNVYQRDNLLKEDLLYKQFLCEVYSERYHDALQSAFLLYNQFANDIVYNENLKKCLYFIGAHEEEIVESVRSKSKPLTQTSIHYKENKYYIELYSKLQNNRKKIHFVIIPYKCMSVVSRRAGLVQIANVLYHLGNKISFIYEPISEYEREILDKEELLFNSRGFVVPYQGYLLENIKKQGVNHFINSLPDEDIVVISRRSDMFVEKSRLNNKKNVKYVFPDFTDKRDSEFIPAEKELDKKEIDSLYSKADIILTKDKEFRSSTGKVVLWNDSDVQETWKLCDERCGLGTNHRLSKRAIGMVADLINAL